jgi:hypothetical protein
LEKGLEIAHDVVIPAEAGIQAFSQLTDFKAKDTEPQPSDWALTKDRART